MKFIFTLVAILSCLNSNPLYAQKSEATTQMKFLKGLTLAFMEEAFNQNIQIDGESTPIYNSKGKRIRDLEMVEALSSGDYTPDFYVNETKEIKVIYLRIAGEEEKK